MDDCPYVLTSKFDGLKLTTNGWANTYDCAIIARIPQMILILADDILCLISDFLQSPILSHVCKSTWYLLQQRHLTRRIGPSFPALAPLATTHSLSLYQRWWDGPVAPILQQAPALTSLTLRLCFWGPNASCAISALTTSCTLQILTLKLATKVLPVAAVETLATVKDIPMLTSLSLELPRQRIGPIGVKALAALQDASALTALSLNLFRNRVGDAGAQAVSCYKCMSSLTRLRLNLLGNGITDKGLQALAALRESRTLTALTLDVESDRRGIEAIDALKEREWPYTFPPSIFLHPSWDGGVHMDGCSPTANS